MSRVDERLAKQRLLGTWRSDRKRTMRSWVFPKPLSERHRKRFAHVFGKATWRFTRLFCYGQYEELQWKGPYRILWADPSSAVVVFEQEDGENCHHLFFDGDHFYFCASRNGNVEFFKKVAA